MSAPVLAEVLRPSAKAPARIYDAALIAGFSLIVAVTAQISIPLPFTPVPVTLQTLAVVLTGALLGSRRGTLAILLYLAEGFAGLPGLLTGQGGIHPPLRTHRRLPGRLYRRGVAHRLSC